MFARPPRPRFSLPTSTTTTSAKPIVQIRADNTIIHTRYRRGISHVRHRSGLSSLTRAGRRRPRPRKPPSVISSTRRYSTLSTARKRKSLLFKHSELLQITTTKAPRRRSRLEVLQPALPQKADATSLQLLQPIIQSSPHSP